MRTLVTGATGYLGSLLTRHFLEEGYEVHALLRRSSDETAVPLGAEIHRHDGTAEGTLRVVRTVRPDWLLHLAAEQTPDPDPDTVDSLVEANVLLGTQLAYACARVGVSAFVNTGTQWQHLDSEGYRPTTLYAATKQALVDILAYFADAEGLPAITLELPGTYGPHDTRRKVLDLLIDAQRSGRVLEMSPGDQVMDLVHVDDVIAGFVRAARTIDEDPSRAGSTFALHASEMPTLRELVTILEEVTGVAVPVRFGALPYRDRELMQPSATLTLPGWHPQIGLHEGVRQLASSSNGATR